MPFSEEERRVLLAVKGVGPTVLARLEQLGIACLSDLAECDPEEVCTDIAARLGSTCWRNSPQARTAIAEAILAARAITGS